MAYFLNDVRQGIKNIITKAAAAAFPLAALPEIVLETPREGGHGDFSTNIAMLLKADLKMAPRAIAEGIVSHIENAPEGLRVEIAGPGFINFFLKPGWVFGILNEIAALDTDYGKTDIGGGESVLIEFVSANPTGPMHMGNARGGATGDVLARAMDKAGYKVSREFYINDAGAQIDKFGRSLEARYLAQLGEDVVFPEDGYHGEDITWHAKEYISKHADSLLGADSEKRRRALVDYALGINLSRLKSDLERYKIKYNTWFSESSLYESGEVSETLRLLKESGMTYEKDGALWLDCSRFNLEKDDVLVRANGIPTYFAADIAYHRNKLQKRGFSRAINVWGADHHGHIARMKGALSAIGCDPERFSVIVIQLVRLTQKGEVVRMSKRTGKMVTLGELLDETGVDAARFFFNLRAPGSHLDFDLALAVEQSNDNPVFYVQYAHARICSILRLLEKDGVDTSARQKTDIAALTDPAESALARRMADFPDEIAAVCKNLEPSRLTRFAIDIASLFHSFYSSCRVRTDDEALTAARVRLIDCARIVIRNSLDILGVSVPEKM